MVWTFDEEQFYLGRKVIGLNLSNKNVLAKSPSGAMYTVSLKRAIEKQLNIHEQLNKGNGTGAHGKQLISDITAVEAFQLDYEYEIPQAAHDVGCLFMSALRKRGIIEEGQTRFDTGRGDRIIICTKMIFTKREGDAQKVSDAWEQVVNTIIRDIFQECCYKIGVQLTLDFCPINQPAAANGTTRPYNPRKSNEPDFLRDGYLRKIIEGDGQRHLSLVLQAMVINAFKYPVKPLQHFVESQKSYPEVILSDMNTFMALDDLNEWLAREDVKKKYTKKDGSFDRDRTFCGACHHMTAKFRNRDLTLKLACEINEIVGSKYTPLEAVQKANCVLKRHQNYSGRSIEGTLPSPETKKRAINISQTNEEILNKWIDTVLIENSAVHLPKELAYQAYEEFCSKMKQMKVTQNVFFRTMKNKGFMLCRPCINGERVYCYKGIDIRDVFSKTDAEWITILSQQITEQKEI